MASKLEDVFAESSSSSFHAVTKSWVETCGLSEFALRAIILHKILTGQDANSSIRKYIDNHFHYVLRNRIRHSKEVDFGYRYANNEAYYSFLPFRHPMDSIIQSKAEILLERKNLNQDEYLICKLFSGDVDTFFEESTTRRYRQSIIGERLHQKELWIKQREFKFAVYTGLSTPSKSDDVFTRAPILGLGMGGPLSDKLVVDFAIKFRINRNDKSFYYYALGDTNYVNSDESVFFGGIFRYSLYNKPKLRVSSDLGVGLESVSTGLSKQKDHSTEKEYYHLRTIHLSFGFSAITPIYGNHSIGLGINYHYCPYQLDRNLHSTIDNNLMSVEVFWKF